MQEMLTKIFTEAFLSRTLWQFATEVHYAALMAFETQDMLVPTMVAIVGAVLAGYVNNLCGRLLGLLQDRGHLALSEEKYEKARGYADSLVWVVGLLSWYYLASVLIFACGFLRIAQWKIILSVIIGQVAFYGYRYLDSIGALAS